METNIVLRSSLHTIKRKGVEKFSQEKIDYKQTKAVVIKIGSAVWIFLITVVFEY